MKKFSKMILNEKEWEGKGYYSQSSDEIHVRAIDADIRIAFREVQQENSRITHIAFTGEEADADFTGDYVIESIYGNQISLSK